MSTCPLDYATSVPTEKVQYSLNLECVSLQHYGIKRNVRLTNRSGWQHFEVFDTKRAVLSVPRGLSTGSMIEFTRDGKGQIVNDKMCIEQVKQIMESTPGFDIVCDRRAFVLVVDVNDGVYVNDERRQFDTILESVFLSFAKSMESQAQQDHERQQTTMSVVKINTHLSRSR